MNPKYRYWVAIALLVAMVNLSLLASMTAPRFLPVAIGGSILLVLVIVLRNRKVHAERTRNRILLLSALGAFVTVVDLRVGFAYSIIGLLFLMATQLRILAGGHQGWWLIGGNPAHKLDETESKMATYGLSMVLSVALTFFAKVIWMSTSI